MGYLLGTFNSINLLVNSLNKFFRAFHTDIHGLPSGPAIRILIYRIQKAVYAHKRQGKAGFAFPVPDRAPRYLVTELGNGM